MIGLTKALALEMGKHNVAVNAICPGFIVTDLNRHNGEKVLIAEKKSVLPIRFALDDIISFITMLSSDMINGVSGRVFNLD